MRQFPTIWRSDTIPIFEINKKYRSWNLNENLVCKNRFEKFLIKILPTYMPRSYLEGFKILEKKSDKSFPRYPGAIFTSNSYAYDDFFKIWAAKKSIKKIPIIIGQHGGHMGTCLFGFYLTHQFKISNFFLTWGWKEVKKNYPLVNLLLDKKNLIKSKNDLKNKKKIILVLTGWPKFSYHISAQPISVQYIDYLKDIFKFNSYLNEKVKQNLIVKEYFQNFDWIDKNLIKKEFKNIEIYDGKKKLKEFYKISKLIISTSNSTSFLESMALNIPTILFFNPVHSELNKSAKKQFLELKRVGIYHETAESAANHLVKIENNICEWWFSHKLQVVRLNFCKKYSIFSDKKVSILKNFFYKLKQK